MGTSTSVPQAAWVGFLCSTENSLRNTADPSDRLEIAAFASGLLLEFVLFARR
jgi:hypothetical protein